MTDKQDSNDEIQSISLKFQSFSTADPNLNPQEQSKITQPVPKMNISTSTHSLQDGKKSSVSDDNLPVRNLPELNLPEKIIFVIDTVKEHDCTSFKLGTGAKYTPLFMIKRVVEIFVSAKSMLQRRHEFALMTLDSQAAHWVCDFTSNVKSILNYLDTITEDTLEEEQKTYDLGQAFEKIRTHAHLPATGDSFVPPTFVTRVILIYSRSHCVPKFQTSDKDFEQLTENPYFFLDSLFVHEPPSSENKCDEAYAELTALDTKNFSYILEVGRNATKLHDNMAKLMAHPLQRPVQKDTCYTIHTSTTSQEVHTNV
ncbi:BRISC and BRCA1-A complex member 1 [Cephus cinctus]|uniref:BRISC and BRCA1-A complex member 1 n=1 Tax=Cephus cinctus TaxID=211228 RepID=A0AAJ7BMG2_CEPCN|nr:BRISC and BRCA1-A complex member 1 [Cephus cinctus]